MQIATTTIDTPLGRYAVRANEVGLVEVSPCEATAQARATEGTRSPAERLLERACAAFASYFAGDPAPLDALPVDPRGSEFSLRVWRALREIPAGATASYREIARRIGSPRAARAIGDANRRNPIAIAIPCHRVIGSDGRLVGYAGSLARKRWLLDHEAACARAQAASSKSNGPQVPRFSTALARSRESAAASI